MTNLSKFPAETLEQAIAWHTRLTSGEETESDWNAFTQWLEASPEHQSAYEEVEEFSSSISEQAVLRTAAVEVPVKLRRNRAALASRLRPFWLAGAPALAVVLLLFVAIRQQRSEFSSIEYSTRIGEARSVRLADGSVVELNTATRLRVLIVSTERRVILVQGEALFHVVRNEGRPFEVSIGEHAIRVVGTVFDVMRMNAKLRVTVAEGRVNFSDTRTGQALSLLSGDQLVYTPESGPQVRHVSPNATAAWRKGYLVYENATLAEVIEDLNRYFARRIALADAGAARQRFSGALRLDREEVILNRLAHLLPITPDYSRNNVILLHSSPKKD